ncbi:MAG: chaperone modulator CbpM [Steroidobacterales bacterium]
MLTGTIVEEVTILTTSELGRLCTVEVRQIVELVEEGILSVEDESGGEWRFAPSSLRRARTALRLQQDLGLNLAGVALTLELLDEIAELRRQLHLAR